MDRKLLKLYVEKFTKSEIDFHGIKLKLSLESNELANLPIIIEMENPLNKPYTSFAIEGEFIKSFRSFVNLLGEETRQYQPLHYCQFLNVKKIHITEEFHNKIKKAGQTIKTFYIKTTSHTIDLKYRNFDINVDNDEIEVNVKFVVEKLFDNDAKKEKETIYLYKVFDKAYEYWSIPEMNSELCSPIASVIYDEPTFFDQHDAYLKFDCDFLTKAGTEI